MTMTDLQSKIKFENAVISHTFNRHIGSHVLFQNVRNSFT
jgi:hypothetical protein